MSRRCIRRKLLGRTALAFAGSLSALTAASTAHAQINVAPPLPNVFLLVDTSGSMEFKTDGTPVTCNPGNALLTNERNRWTNVVEVLTGTFQNFSCESIDRVSNVFKTGEYQLVTGTAPYDWRYPIPYHRPLSGVAAGCAAGPGTLPGASPTNPFMWPSSNAVRYHTYSDTSQSCTTSQAPDGILDEFRSRVRFGLMTFDTEVNASTGYAPASGNYTSANVNTPGGQAGLYSYVVGSPATGKPMGCATASIAQEVGARNGAAPAWEGRMINFGNPNDAERAYETKGDHIQEVLLATRPFGATPIAGMLHDAEDFFWNDTSDDPDVFPPATPHPFDDYGPHGDPYLSCPLAPRDQVLILLTDGEPNMDLRPFCSDAPVGGLPAGACPFELPEDITYRLAHPSSGARKAIKTFVVGFALELVDADLNAATPNVSCSTLVTPAPPAPGPRTLSAACAAPGVANNVPLQACCTLQRIAIAGDGDAYFATNAADLRSSISDILARSVPTTSRTQPAVSSGGAATGGSYRFFSGFEVGRERLWKGKLQRKRWECDNSQPDRPISEAEGDDFVANVNSADPANRRFYTVVGKNGGTVVRGTETARANIGPTDLDGAGIVTTEVHTGTAAAFASAVPTAAMDIPDTARPPGVTNDNQERTFFLEWLLGVNAATARHHRCRSFSDCSLIGDIYHSTPQIAGAPSALLRDESYERFSLANKLRPIVLYTSTNDGFLHAFKVGSNDIADAGDDIKTVSVKTNNELWAFAPPGVLPNLHALYPYNHQNLLDGTATIRDVVAIEEPTPTDPPTRFERTGNDARAGAGTWRTVLVQGFGSDHAGYFAVDVTTPVPGSDPTNTDQGGPRFLWQLTKDVSGNPIFGRGGATPAIATLFFDPAGGTNAREIPVAVLPGGPGGTRITGGSGCPAAPRTFPGVAIDSRFTPRGKVNCYDYGSGNAEMGARSLTIVRLDTGEIIRTFRQNLTDVANATLRTRVTLAELDSPITGQPVAFPGQTGSVADRIIVGDQDGRLWKVNVTSMNPANWTMKLFFDLYPASIQATTAHSFDDGQPIELAPVLSIDENGDMTVNAATGAQDALGLAPGQDHYVYSFTDDFDLTRTTGRAKVNWLLKFANGKHVLGPLNLFNQNLYFATIERAASTSVCENGTTTIYGVDYVRAFDPSDPLNLNPTEFELGGKPASDADNSGAITIADQVIETFTNSISAGFSIVQQPACYTAAPDPIGDDLVGFRGLTRITEVGTGTFQLIMHASAPAAGADQPVNVRTIDLPTQKSESRIASWASIIE